MNKRAALILKHMIQSDETVNGVELASVLGTTSKTVGEEIRRVSEILRHFGADIISIKGIGYKLRVNNKTEFEIFAQCFYEKLLNETEWTYYPAERMDYLLYHLCFDGKSLKSAEAADRLFISQSTLSSDLKRIRLILEEYHLTLCHKPFYGVTMEGLERHKRYLMMKYMYSNEEEAYLDYGVLEFRLDSKKVHDTLIRAMERGKVRISEKGLDELVRYLIISDYRYARGNAAEPEEHIDSYVEKTEDYRLVCQIMEQLHILENESERKNLTCFLMGRRDFVSDEELDLSYLIFIRKIVDGVFRDLESRTKTTVGYPGEMKKKIRLSFASMYMRLSMGVEYGYQNINMLKEDIVVFDYVLAICDILYERYGLKLREYDIAEFYYIVKNDIERHYEKYDPLDIVYISASGLNRARYYAREIKKAFPDYIRRERFLEYYEVENIKLEDGELIITDLPKQRFWSKENRVFQIREHLNTREMKRLSGVLAMKDKEREKWRKFFPKAFYISNIDLQDKQEIIRLIVDKFAESGLVDKRFGEMVQRREQLVSSELDHGVALLSGIYQTSSFAACGLGILKRPILWEKEYVQLIIMVSEGRDAYELARRIKKRLDSVKVIHSLIHSANYEEAVELLADCKL